MTQNLHRVCDEMTLRIALIIHCLCGLYIGYKLGTAVLCCFAILSGSMVLARMVGASVSYGQCRLSCGHHGCYYTQTVTQLVVRLIALGFVCISPSGEGFLRALVSGIGYLSKTHFEVVLLAQIALVTVELSISFTKDVLQKTRQFVDL